MRQNNINHQTTNETKDYILIDAKAEYGNEYTGPRWFIATSLSREQLENKYPKFVADHADFEIVPLTVGDAIKEGTRELERIIKRDARHQVLRYEDCTEYEYFLTLYDAHQVKEAEQSALQTKQERLYSAINKLDPTQKRRFKMRYFDGMAVKTIAQKEGVSPTAVSLSISCAKKNLKKMLAEA